jgi:tetratricopeptide (TPR) repeat protein
LPQHVASRRWPSGRGRRPRCDELGSQHASSFCALLAKEVALSALVAVALGELWTKKGTHWRQHAIRLAPVALASAVYAGLRHRALSNVKATDDGLHGPIDRLLAAADALGHYAEMLLDPFRPRLQIGILTRPSNARVAVGIVFVFLAAGLFAFAKARIRTEILSRAFVGIGMSVISLMLVLHLVAIPVNVSAADRFLYFPSAGLALGAAVVLSEANTRAKRATAALATGFSLASAPFLNARNEDWADELRLWTKTVVETNFDNVIALGELGNVAYRAGAGGAALDVYQAARDKLSLERGETDERIAANIGTVLGFLGRYEEALEVRQELVQRYPDSGALWTDLAKAEWRLLRFDHARNTLDSARAHGVSTATVERLIEYVETCKKEATALANASSTPTERHARFEMRLTRRREALAAWRDLIARREPLSDTTLNEVALYFLEHGRADDIRALEQHTTPGRYAAIIDQRAKADARQRAASEEIKRLRPRLFQIH